MSTATNGRATPTTTAATSPTRAWSVHDASELYEVSRWGNGYFSVNALGHLEVHPTKDPQRAIDLKQLIDRLQLRGIGLPVLVRFTDILKHRLGEIHGAFQSAISQNNYQGRYHCVYPIKVNQQRQVVEEVLNFGKPYRFGLEAGSKPELLAVVALADNETPIICNGFKDAEYIETAMLAQKIGRNIEADLAEAERRDPLKRMGDWLITNNSASADDLERMRRTEDERLEETFAKVRAEVK